MFERKGFVAATVEDIVAVAGVSHGTFYRYFGSKDQVYRVVELAVQNEILAVLAPVENLLDDGPVTRIERANRRFLEAYRDKAAMAAVIEQVATINADTAEERLALRRRFVSRAQAGVERLQEQGAADPSLDPYHAASALSSMVERFAYIWFVLGEDFEFERSVQTLSRLWAQALGITLVP